MGHDELDGDAIPEGAVKHRKPHLSPLGWLSGCAKVAKRVQPAKRKGLNYNKTGK
jgi:hypothetical protein